MGRSATLHAYIVTPKTTDRLCAPYQTRGEVSCHHDDRVVLNAKRWLLGADSYGSDLTNYRRYLVNHEFGHALGKHHEDCPGSGKLAPVMMQQTSGSAHAARTHGRNPAKIEKSLERSPASIKRWSPPVAAQSPDVIC